MKNRNIKSYLLTALVSLSSLLFAQIVTAESENITGHWNKLPTPKNMPASENFWDLYPEEYPVVDNERGIIYILRNGGELWKYSIQDNAFTRIPTTNFPEEGYNYIYNPNENSIWFTHIGRGATYRLPVTGGESEYIGGSGAYGDNYNSISYWNPVKKKFSLMFGYGYGSVKNWCWQFGIGDANWNLAQENKAGREPWPRMYTSMAQDLDGKRIFIGMGIGNSSGQQYILNPSFVNNRDYDYLRDLWCLHLEDNTWENLIPLNTIKPLRGKLVYYPDSDALFLLNTFTSTALPGDQIYGKYEQYVEGVWMMCLGKDSNFVKIETDGEFPNSNLVAYPFYDSINKRIIYMNSEGAYALSLEGVEEKVPQIIQQPVGVSVQGGERVTFSVEAENVTTYQWYKNGFAIDGANQSSYTIETVTSYDIAKYFVIVSNERISIASDIAPLEISEAYRAKAEPIIANGFVIGFIIADPGWGYEWTPKVRVKDEFGEGAEAHCIVENGMIVGIVVDNPGSGYSEETYVKVGSPYKYNSLSIKVSEIEITMLLNLGEKYQLECTEDHITWEKVGGPFIAEDEEVKLRLEVVDHIRYFRVHEVK